MDPLAPASPGLSSRAAPPTADERNVFAVTAALARGPGPAWGGAVDVDAAPAAGVSAAAATAAGVSGAGAAAVGPPLPLSDVSALVSGVSGLLRRAGSHRSMPHSVELASRATAASAAAATTTSVAAAPTASIPSSVAAPPPAATTASAAPPPAVPAVPPLPPMPSAARATSSVVDSLSDWVIPGMHPGHGDGYTTGGLFSLAPPEDLLARAAAFDAGVTVAVVEALFIEALAAASASEAAAAVASAAGAAPPPLVPQAAQVEQGAPPASAAVATLSADAAAAALVSDSSSASAPADISEGSPAPLLSSTAASEPEAAPVEGAGESPCASACGVASGDVSGPDGQR